MLDAFRRFLGDNDMMAYLAMMTPRMIELRRILKPTGNLFLHCDPKASHYLKILLDAVFGKSHYKNEIIWCYRKWSVAAGQFVRNHDVIHFVSKEREGNKFNVLYTEPSKGTMKRWKGQKQQAVFEGGVRKATSLEEEKAQSAMPDWWEISIINPNAAERLGYPTQKPLTLLKRIILAGSNEGDLVLDPFCGCGTAIHAAETLNRRWIGIDVTHLAIGLIEYRLKNAFGIVPEVIGAPEDEAASADLWRRDPFQFEAWAVTRLLGIKPNERQRGDRGIDGVGRFYLGRDKKGQEHYGKIFVSVKGGENIGSPVVRDFRGAMEREKADLGVIITLHKPGHGMTKEAASAGRYREMAGKDFPKIQVFTIADHFAGRKPDLPPTIEDARRKAEEEPGEQHRLI